MHYLLKSLVTLIISTNNNLENKNFVNLGNIRLKVL